MKSNSKDAEALIGLAKVTDDREEKLELMRRAARADPANHINVDALIVELINGSEREQEESLQWYRRAYDNADGTYKWLVAENYFTTLSNLHRTGEATAFQAEFANDRGIPEAERMLKAAVERGTPVASEALTALETLCADTTLGVGLLQVCTSAISAITGGLTEERTVVRPARAIADAVSQSIFNVMSLDWRLGVQAEVVTEQMRVASGKLRAAGFQSAFSLYVEGGFVSAEERLELLKKATLIEPENGEAFGRLAREYMRRGDPGRAADEFERAVSLVPDYKREVATEDLIQALQQAGRVAEANRWRSSMSN